MDTDNKNSATKSYSAELEFMYQHPMFLVRRIQQIFSIYYAEECTKTNCIVNIPQSKILKILSIVPCISPSNIALLLGFDRPSITSIIATLEQRKLIEISMLNDRRRRAISLTKTGELELISSQKSVFETECKIFAKISANEKEQIYDLFHKIITQEFSPAAEWKQKLDEIELTIDQNNALNQFYRSISFMGDRWLQIANAFSRQGLAEYNFTPGQYGVLYVLANFGANDQINLSRTLGIDKSSISVIVPALKKRNLLESHINDLDRRSVLLNLTQSGIKLFTQIKEKANEAAAKINFILLPEDSKNFIKIIQKILKNLERQGFSFTPK